MESRRAELALVFGALGALGGGCGISLVGQADPNASAGDAAVDAGDGAGGSVTGLDGASTDGGVVEGGVDGASEDAGKLDPLKVHLSYGLGHDGRAYRFDLGTKMFTPLPSAGCPSGEETAVTVDGAVYFTSTDSRSFYKLTATGCELIKGSSSFPYAFGTAPKGTVSQASETLVGYTGADYVRVDPATGAVTTITPGALGTLRPSGDMCAVGLRGFLSAASGSGACPGGGDCIVEVDLTTGVPVSVGTIKQLVGLGIYGLAHSGGQLLLFANGQVYPFDVTTLTLGASIAIFPVGAGFTGAGAAAGAYP